MATPSAGTTTGQATDEAELTKLRRQQYWSQVQRMKLLMDLIFVCASRHSPVMNLLTRTPAYDVFHIKRYSNTAKTLSGLASAVLR